MEVQRERGSHRVVDSKSQDVDPGPSDPKLVFQALPCHRVVSGLPQGPSVLLQDAGSADSAHPKPT